MALTGVITLAPGSTVAIGHPVNVTLTVTDSGAANPSLTSVQPTCVTVSNTVVPDAPAIMLGECDVYKGNATNLAGVAEYNFSVVVNNKAGSYSISAIAYSSNSPVTVTPATLTVV